MFKLLNKRRQKGQSTLEYAILIIIVIAALLSIQVYIKRGIQGKLKSSADDIGEQFSPGNQNVLTVRTTTSKSRDVFASGVTNSTLLEDETTIVDETSNVINVQWEFWGN